MGKRSGPRPPKPDGVEPNIRKKKPRAAAQLQAALPSLNDVSRELPSAAEIDQHFERIREMPDREAAMALGSLLDAFLEHALCLGFTGMTVPGGVLGLSVIPKTQLDALFRDSNAPLASWSSKIILAHTIRIFSDEVRGQLDLIRRIRNAYAHGVRHLDFSNPTLSTYAMKLDCSRMNRGGRYDGGRDDPRGRFEEACFLISGHLLAYVLATANAHRTGAISVPPPFQSRFV